MVILILSSVDAMLTLALMSRGAVEINPLMEPLVRGSGHSFALWKLLGLTSMGVVVLTMVARLRVVGQVSRGSPPLRGTGRISGAGRLRILIAALDLRTLVGFRESHCAHQSRQFRNGL